MTPHASINYKKPKVVRILLNTFEEHEKEFFNSLTIAPIYSEWTDSPARKSDKCRMVEKTIVEYGVTIRFVLWGGM